MGNLVQNMALLIESCCVKLNENTFYLFAVHMSCKWFRLSQQLSESAKQTNPATVGLNGKTQQYMKFMLTLQNVATMKKINRRR